jgi:dTDP-4-dehydrorhamnose 3,5-epimerase
MTNAFALIPTPLEGLFVVDVPVFRDARGFFLESYHRRKFAELGCTAEFVQDNHSRSAAGVVRGLHYQDLTAPMAKLVRCTRGVIFDVAVDLRVGSPTFGRWYGLELSEENARQLFVPVGFGHGFAVLSDWADVQYKCTGFYTPAAEGGVAWDDPEIGISWPVKTPLVSPRDRTGLSLRQYQAQPVFHYPVA